MDNNISVLQNDARNRKKAYFAMCRVSLVMLLFVFSSRFLSESLITFLHEKTTLVENGFVYAMSFFGIESPVSRVTIRLILSSNALYEILGIIISLVTFVLPFVIFRRCSGIRHTECFELSGKVIKWAIPMFFLCQLLTAVVSTMAHGIYGFLAPADVVALGDSVGVLATEFNIYEFIIQMLCSCIIVPLTEECIFRGVIFTYLKKYGICFAAVASASLFGVAHGYPVQSVHAFCFGIFSVFLYVVTGNLKTSIIFHAVNNFITMCAGYLIGSVGEWVFGVFNAVFITMVTALGFAAFYKMFGKDGYFEVLSKKIKENDGEILEKCGMKEVLVFPFAAYVIYYVLDIVSRVLVNI